MNDAAKTPPAPRVPVFQGSTVFITASCLRVAEGCFELAGGSAVYETSPIGRRIQDIRVAAQYALVHARNYVPAGGAIMERLSAVHSVRAHREAAR
jgi:hypothetical protein